MCAGRKWLSGMQEKRRIIFFVTAEGDALAYDHAVATLETRGRTNSAKAMVHIYPAVHVNYSNEAQGHTVWFDEMVIQSTVALR